MTFAQVEMSIKFAIRDLIQASTVMRRVKKSESKMMIRSSCKVSGWYVEVSTDASFSNLNDEVHNTGAYVILIRNGGKNLLPLLYIGDQERSEELLLQL